MPVEIFGMQDITDVNDNIFVILKSARYWFSGLFVDILTGNFVCLTVLWIGLFLFMLTK